MARIRSIKPEVRISEKVNSWPIECRYFWVLLWGYCDDYGYGRDNTRLIVADSFPLDDSITAEMVEGWMNTIWESDVITRFAVGDHRYFQVINWDEHQKIAHPAKQFLPTIEEASEVFLKPSVIPRQVAAEFENSSPKQGAGSREQGAVKGSMYVAPLELDPLFDSCWIDWPKKVDRTDARRRFGIAATKVDPTKLAAMVSEFGRAYAATTEKQFTPALGSWLHRCRWTDELPSAQEFKREAPRQSAASKNLDTVAYFKQQEENERKAIGQ